MLLFFKLSFKTGDSTDFLCRSKNQCVIVKNRFGTLVQVTQRSVFSVCEIHRINLFYQEWQNGKHPPSAVCTVKTTTGDSSRACELSLINVKYVSKLMRGKMVQWLLFYGVCFSTSQ